MEIPKALADLSEAEADRKRHIGKITTQVLRYLTAKFTEERFEWFLPVVFSKSTDPLWPDPAASIEKRIEVEIYGELVRTTSSMIIHKVIACSLCYPRLFVLSPNVRIEKSERRTTGRHAYEFTQLDFEVLSASSRDIMSLSEKILCGLMEYLKANSRESLDELGRYESLRVPETPFKVYDREELERKYGKDWDSLLPLEIRDPVWITNIPREFYDFEDFRSRKWDNYDLFLPEYGEVLSGAKREWEHDKIIAKMERDGVAKENYRLLLKLAKEGRVKPTAGAGIGLERLVGWIVAAKHIAEVQPFPKIPGMVHDL